MKNIKIVDVYSSDPRIKLADGENYDFTEQDYHNEQSDYMIADLLTDEALYKYKYQIKNSYKKYKNKLKKIKKSYHPLKLFEYSDGSGTLVNLPEPDEFRIVRHITEHFIVICWQKKSEVFEWRKY